MSTSTPSPRCSTRQIVAASGPHLTTETQSLLRFRLRAAAAILLIGFGAFLVRHIVGVLATEPLDPLLLGSHIAVVLVLAANLLVLCCRCTVPLAKLRVAELSRRRAKKRAPRTPPANDPIPLSLTHRSQS